MKTCAAYLDAIRERYNLNSDGKLSALLGVTRASVSRLRNGEDSFSDSTARRVAELLEIDAAPVMALAHALRSKTAEDRALWLEIFRRLGGHAAGFFLFALLMIPGLSPSPAEASTSGNSADCYCFQKSKEPLFQIFPASQAIPLPDPVQ